MHHLLHWLQKHLSSLGSLNKKFLRAQWWAQRWPQKCPHNVVLWQTFLCSLSVVFGHTCVSGLWMSAQLVQMNRKVRRNFCWHWSMDWIRLVKLQLQTSASAIRGCSSAFHPAFCFINPYRLQNKSLPNENSSILNPFFTSANEFRKSKAGDC